MSKKQKKVLTRICISAVLLALCFAAERFLIPERYSFAALVCYLVPYFVIGYDVIRSAFRKIIRGQAMDESFLMTVATVGALCIGFFPSAEPQYAEAVFVMLFYQVGELFQSIAVGKSRRSIEHLLELCPDTANVLRDGTVTEVGADEVSVGETVVVKPGERIAVDGTVTDGRSAVDVSMLTGESKPKRVEKGDNCYSGCINLSGVLYIKTTAAAEDSTASKILELVENSSENKSKSEDFITKFARVYTPFVVFSAIILCFVPPLFSDAGYFAAFPSWLLKAFSFLVISCPCALVISVPMSFFGGIGSASRSGILVKGSNSLEALANAKTFVFDKTGTLTEGCFSVTAVHPDTLPEDKLLHLAALAESGSDHPIAKSIRAAAKTCGCDGDVQNVTETAGYGVEATVDGIKVVVGSERFMQMHGMEPKHCHRSGTVIHVGTDGEYAGHIVISDKIKDNAKTAAAELKKLGVAKTVMLTGDGDAVAGEVAKEIGLDEYKAEMLPADKVKAVEELLTENGKGTLAFIGDGINDAPVLTKADVGIAMGALGSDAAIEASDIVLMDDDPGKTVLAVKIARKTQRIVKQNVIFALTVKAAVLVLGALGFAPMWLAVFADVGVAVIAILNAMRTLRPIK